VVRQNAMVAAFQAGTKDQGLLYLDTRMANRRTFLLWDTTILGPIIDKRGLEQSTLTVYISSATILS
jgi:hypothetical protein